MRKRTSLSVATLQGDGGFSILETIVGAAILLLIATGVLSALTYSINTASGTKSYIAAGAVLQREVEIAKSLGGNVTPVPFSQSTDTPAFGVERVVTQNSPQTGLNKATIRVYKYPKQSGDQPLSETSVYIRQSGSGL